MGNEVSDIPCGVFPLRTGRYRARCRVPASLAHTVEGAPRLVCDNETGDLVYVMGYTPINCSWLSGGPIDPSVDSDKWYTFIVLFEHSPTMTTLAATDGKPVGTDVGRTMLQWDTYDAQSVPLRDLGSNWDGIGLSPTWAKWAVPVVDSSQADPNVSNLGQPDGTVVKPVTFTGHMSRFYMAPGRPVSNTEMTKFPERTVVVTASGSMGFDSATVTCAANSNVGFTVTVSVAADGSITVSAAPG